MVILIVPALGLALILEDGLTLGLKEALDEAEALSLLLGL